MKAIRIHEYGDRSVLRYEDAPVPAVQERDVLVRVRAAGVNPADWQFRRGDYRQYAPLRFPAILGWDVSGTVERLGVEATGFQPGEAVYAMCDMMRDGAYAEFVAVDCRHLAPAPRTLSLEESAAVPLAALTAWQSLYDIGQLQSAQSVLVGAAAGMVGQFAVQLARNCGARVVAVARTVHHEYLRAIGADDCVDYTRPAWSESLHDFDLVLDGAGGDTREASWGTLRPGGMLVAIAMPPADVERAAAQGYRAATARVMPDGERLRKITAFIDEGCLSVEVESVFRLEDAAEAHARSESRRACGKVLLEPARS